MSKKQEKNTAIESNQRLPSFGTKYVQALNEAIKTKQMPHVAHDQKTEILLEIRDMLKRFFDRVDSTGTLGK